MRRVAILACGLALALASALLVWPQEAAGVPENALVFELGAQDHPYETLGAGTRGGTLTLSLGGNPESWNPIVATTAYASALASYYLQSLIGFYPTGEHYGELAESWEVAEGGLDILFHLRRGLRWSDGVPFTADDVLFTYNDLLLNEDIASANRDLLRLPGGGFPEIEKLDSQTIRVTSRDAFRPLLDAFTLPVLPKHKLASFIHKLNPDVPAGTFNGAWGVDAPVEELIGMGPFLVEAYQPDLAIVLRANPLYYHYDGAGTKLPYLDKVMIRLGASDDLQVLQFLDGEIDLIEARTSDVPILKGLESRKEATLILGEVDRATRFLSFNQDVENEALRSLFRQLAFRQAMSHAIDWQHIVDVLHLGLAYPLWSPVSVPSPFYAGRDRYAGPITEHNAVLYPYDLERAAALLDACGIFDSDGDGVREFEDGSDVEFALSYAASAMEDIALILTEDLAKIGVKANPKHVDFNTLVERLLSGTGVESVLIGFSGGNDPHAEVGSYGSTGALHFWHYSAGHGDRYDYETRIDELYRLGSSTYDMDEAFGYYKELQLLFAKEDLGLIFIVTSRFACAASDRVGNAGLCAMWGTALGGPLTELLYIR